MNKTKHTIEILTHEYNLKSILSVIIPIITIVLIILTIMTLQVLKSNLLLLL